MPPIRLASLRDRLVALVLVAALPTLGLAVYGYVTQRHEAAREGREAALQVARGLARAHEQRLGETRRLLVTLSALPETRADGLPGVRGPASRRSSGSSRTSSPWAWPAADGEVTCSAGAAVPARRT